MQVSSFKSWDEVAGLVLESPKRSPRTLAHGSREGRRPHQGHDGRFRQAARHLRFRQHTLSLYRASLFASNVTSHTQPMTFSRTITATQVKYTLLASLLQPVRIQAYPVLIVPLRGSTPIFPHRRSSTTSSDTSLRARAPSGSTQRPKSLPSLFSCNRCAIAGPRHISRGTSADHHHACRSAGAGTARLQGHGQAERRRHPSAQIENTNRDDFERCCALRSAKSLRRSGLIWCNNSHAGSTSRARSAMSM